MLNKEQAIQNLGDEEAALRRSADAAWDALQEADQQLQSARSKAIEARNERYAALQKAFDEGEAALDAEVDAEVAPLQAARDAAQQAWQDVPSNGNVVFDWNFDDEPKRCWLTGFMICEEDATSEIYGETVLSQCLGIDPALLEDEPETGGDNAPALPADFGELPQ